MLVDLGEMDFNPPIRLIAYNQVLLRTVNFIRIICCERASCMLSEDCVHQNYE